MAQALEFTEDEVVEWIIEDKANLILHRRVTEPSLAESEEE